MTESDERARLRATYEAAWNKADVRPIYWKMTLPQFGNPGQSLRDYLQHGEYETDRNSGVGLYIHGRGFKRHQVLPTLAKELVMLGDRVQYVSMRKLVVVVNQGGEDYDLLLRTSALCVGQFYDDTVEKPYSGYDLSNVEDFLRTRIENGHRVCLSATLPLREAVWYPQEFRELIGDYTREFSFGN
jgi:hypothetical protein